MRLIVNGKFLRRHAGRWLTAGAVLVGSVGIDGQRPADGGFGADAGPCRADRGASPPPARRDAADLARSRRGGGGAVPKAATDFASAVRLFAAGKYAEALPLFTAPALADTPLAAYATYYSGLCSLNLSRAADARAAFANVRASRASGFVVEAAIGP